MYREGTTVQYGVQWTTRLRGSPGLTVRRRCTTTWAAALASCHVIERHYCRAYDARSLVVVVFMFKRSTVLLIIISLLFSRMENIKYGK